MSILSRIRAWRFRAVHAEVLALDDEIEELEQGDYLANQNPAPSIRKLYRRREKLEEKLSRLSR